MLQRIGFENEKYETLDETKTVRAMVHEGQPALEVTLKNGDLHILPFANDTKLRQYIDRLKAEGYLIDASDF